MEIRTLASGSTGNCYLIDGEPRLLLEAGIPIRKIKEGLDFQLSSVAGCFISHQHMDHAKAVKDLMRAGIDCYVSAETAEALDLSGHRLHVVEPLKTFSVGPWKVMPFPVVHDAPGALGFVVAGGSHKICYITDSAYSPYRYKGVTIFMIEVNFDHRTLRENLAQGAVESELYKRLLKTHLSLETAIGFFKAQDLSRLEQVHVLHISERNADAERIKREIQEVCGCPVYIEGRRENEEN